MLKNSLNNCFSFPQCIVTVRSVDAKSASDESKRLETAVLIFQRDGSNNVGLSPLEPRRLTRAAPTALFQLPSAAASRIVD